MLCTKFIWNWLSGSFLKVANVFFLFCNYIPMEIGVWLKWIPFIQEFQRNWSSSSGEKDENVESLQKDGQTELTSDIWSEKGGLDTTMWRTSFRNKQWKWRFIYNILFLQSLTTYRVAQSLAIVGSRVRILHWFYFLSLVEFYRCILEILKFLKAWLCVIRFQHSKMWGVGWCSVVDTRTV